MEEVVQTYVREQVLHGGGARRPRHRRHPEQGLRIGEPRMGHPQHAHDEVPARLDHQAVHRRVDSAARGTRQAEARGSDQEVRARRARGMGRDHDLQPADALVRDSEFHQPAGLQLAEAPGHAGREDGRDRARQAARLRPRRENELQQLRLSRARRRDRADHRRELREVRERQHLHAAWHEGLGLRLEYGRHRPPGRRIHAVAGRSGQRRLRPYERPACGRRALFHDRGSAALGAGPVRRQAALAPPRSRR